MDCNTGDSLLQRRLSAARATLAVFALCGVTWPMVVAAQERTIVVPAARSAGWFGSIWPSSAPQPAADTAVEAPVNVAPVAAETMDGGLPPFPAEEAQPVAVAVPAESVPQPPITDVMTVMPMAQEVPIAPAPQLVETAPPVLEQAPPVSAITVIHEPVAAALPGDELPANVATPPVMMTQPTGPAPALDGVPLAPEVATAGGEDGLFIRSLSGGDGVVSLNLAGAAMRPDIAEPIMLDEAVAFALKNNFEAKASASAVKSAYWEKIGAYSQFIPSVEAKISAGNEKSSPAAYNDQFGDRVTSDSHTRRDRLFAVRQPLIDLAAIEDILSGGSKEGLASEQQRDMREGIAFDTVTVYLRLIQARISIQLADEYKGYLNDLGQRMQARVEGGGATAGDLDRINGRAMQAESARIEAVGEYEANLAEFRRLTQVTPAQLVVPDRLAPGVPNEIDDAIARAIAANPSYLGGLYKVDIASSARDRSFAKLAPRVALEYSETYAKNAGGAAGGNPIDGVYPVQDDKRLLLVAHWSLNGGVDVTSGLSGREKVRQARYQSQDARERIEQAIRSGYNAINAADQRMAVLRSGVDSNARVVKEFEDQYKNGRRSLFELLDAHEQLYGARVNLMRLSIAKAQASYLVRRQMGELVPTLIDRGTNG